MRVGPEVSSSLSDSLRLGLAVPARAAVSRSVRLVLQVKNTSDRTIALHIGGEPAAYDFVVSRPDGTVVWRWLDGKAHSLSIQRRTLRPRELLEFRGEWDQRGRAGRPVPPGVYVVRGILPTGVGPELETEPERLMIVR